MNSWPNESLAECHRLRIIEEVKQIHLEKLALKSRRRYRLHFLRRTLFNFGNWMISTGKQLRKRYEIPKEEIVYNEVRKFLPE